MSEHDTNYPRTAEEMENRGISLAMNTAIRQMEEGTASPNVICHFLRLATQKERAEVEKLTYQTELLKTQREAIEKAANSELMYAEALAAMKEYKGETSEDVQ